MTDVWFLFLLLGLKLPVLFLGWFLYRVMVAHDRAWENDGWDDDDGGGGGGGPAPVVPPAPRGGPARKRRKREPERTPALGARLAPARPAACADLHSPGHAHTP